MGNQPTKDQKLAFNFINAHNHLVDAFEKFLDASIALEDSQHILLRIPPCGIISDSEKLHEAIQHQKIFVTILELNLPHIPSTQHWDTSEIIQLDKIQRELIDVGYEKVKNKEVEEEVMMKILHNKFQKFIDNHNKKPKDVLPTDVPK